MSPEEALRLEAMRIALSWFSIVNDGEDVLVSSDLLDLAGQIEAFLKG